jgi:hypothetical protein
MCFGKREVKSGLSALAYKEARIKKQESRMDARNV